MTSDISGQPAREQDYAGTPRPDAVIPAQDAGQLAALREVGREWDRVSADPQAWRQALPVDPALGEYPAASEVRPARFTRVVPVAGRDGQLPLIATTSGRRPAIFAFSDMPGPGSGLARRRRSGSVDYACNKHRPHPPAEANRPAQRLAHRPGTAGSAPSGSLTVRAGRPG